MELLRGNEKKGKIYSLVVFAALEIYLADSPMVWFILAFSWLL